VTAESWAATVLSAGANSLWLAPLILLCAEGALRLCPELSALLRYRLLQAAWLTAAVAPWLPTLEFESWGQAAGALPAVAINSVPSSGVLTPEAVSGWAAPPWLAAAWALGVVYGFLRLAAGCRGVVRSKRLAAPGPDELGELFERRSAQLRLGRRFRTLFSEEAWAPLAAGWVRPAVLLPRDLPEQLQSSDVERLWTHEAAHLERWDDWARLVERAARAVYFFNPAFWIAGRRLDFLREAACDRWAADRLGDSRGLAGALARLLSARVEPHGLAPAAAGRPGDLERRIRMLTRQTPEISSSQRRVGSALAAALAAGALGFALGAPRLVLAQAPAAPAVAPSPPVVPQAPAPVVVAQTPTPPAPPAPPAAPSPTPNPAPSPQPRPSPRPHVVVAQSPNPVVTPPRPPQPPRVRVDVDVQEDVKRTMRFHEEIQPEIEAISEIAAKIGAAVSEIDMQEMNLRAQELSRHVQEHVAPLASEMAQLGARMREMGKDSAGFERLREQMEQLEQRLHEKEEILQEMEAQVEAAAARARPDESRIQELEQEMKIHEERIQKKEQEFEAKEKERKQKARVL